MRALLLASGLIVLLAAQPAWSGVLESALEETRDGRLIFSFAANERVYGSGRSIVTQRGRSVSGDCCDHLEQGPVFAMLTVVEGSVATVDIQVGSHARRVRAAAANDLGEVSAAEAADFLLDLVEHAGTGDLADAVLGAAIARGFADWTRMARIARDAERPSSTRKAAVFWLGQAAGVEAGRALVALVGDENTELRLREHAIFALSQREADECFAALERVATTSPHLQLREKAFFWLAQLDDPRAVDLFEQILAQ